MKFRTDFVTNSSSSSFIIGKAKKTDYTVEDIYTLLKDLYIKYDKKRKETIDYIDKHPDCLLNYRLNENYTSFSFKSEYYKLDYEDQIKLENKYANILGWNDFYSYFSYDLKELIFDSYQEYFDYWKNKISHEQKKYMEIPFTICDLRDENAIENMNNLGDNYDFENIIYDLNLEKQDLTKDSFLLDWYLDLYNADKRKKKKVMRKIKKLKRNYNPVYGLLGQICIYSEDGKIPYCIVDELKKICEYSDVHMG